MKTSSASPACATVTPAGDTFPLQSEPRPFGPQMRYLAELSAACKVDCGNWKRRCGPWPNGFLSTHLASDKKRAGVPNLPCSSNPIPSPAALMPCETEREERCRFPNQIHLQEKDSPFTQEKGPCVLLSRGVAYRAPNLAVHSIRGSEPHSHLVGVCINLLS